MKKPALRSAIVISLAVLGLHSATAQPAQQPGNRPITAEEMAKARSMLVQAKLRSITLPSVDFESVTVGEAIDFLRLRTKELDPETDPAKKGFNFIIIDPKDPSAKNIPSSRVIPELRLKNIPADAVLRYICELTGLRYQVEPHAIVIR